MFCTAAFNWMVTPTTRSVCLLFTFSNRLNSHIKSFLPWFLAQVCLLPISFGLLITRPPLSLSSNTRWNTSLGLFPELLVFFAAEAILKCAFTPSCSQMASCPSLIRSVTVLEYCHAVLNIYRRSEVKRDFYDILFWSRSSSKDYSNTKTSTAPHDSWSD